MTRDKASLVGVHRYSFRSGEPAEIIGVEMIAPNGGVPRPCYHVMWSDRTEDWIAIEDESNYKVIGFDDILCGNIPKITQ